MSTSTHPPVTVIGLGAMGSALAAAFLGAGHPTTVWNRSPGKADALAAHGAIPAPSAADAVAASPLVVLCLLDHAAVRDLLESIGAAVAGRVLADLTSETPEQARATARWADEHGATHLDGAIMGDPENVGTELISFLYSGSPDAFEAHRATLGALGGTATYLGPDAGSASLHFMGLIGLGYETWLSYLDTLALVRAEGVPAASFAPYATGMFTAMTGLMTAMADAADDGRHPPDVGPLSVHQPLVRDLIADRRSRGMDSANLERVKRLIDHRVTQGQGGEGFSSLVETIAEEAAIA